MSKRKNAFSSTEPSKISKAEITHIKELVNQVENEEFEELNPTTLKKLVFSFEKKLIRNEQLRLKFKNEPEKFMESEIELDEEIKKFQILATSPDLYKLFVSLKSIESLGSLILHENTDISIDVIDLFNELIEQEDNEQDEGLTLLHSYVDNGVVVTLVDNLSRLDVTADDEQQAIHNTFSIFETMLDLDPLLIAPLLGNKSNFFKFILQYSTNPKTPTPIKLYSSELLSTILLNDEVSRSTFTKKYDGIEQLLVIISQFLKRDVESLQEKEFIENLFSSICSLLLNSESNKELFLKSEGIQLMLLFIKKKTQFRGAALKILDYSLTESKKSNEIFVKELGLKTLFSSFMKKVKSKHNKKVYNEKEDEEHIVTMLYSLLRNLEKTSEYYERLLIKFTENNLEKVDRLLELHDKYYRRVELSDKQLKQEENGEDDEDDDDEILLKRLDAGLFTLQYVDLILLFLSSEDKNIKLKIQEPQIKEIKSIIKEYIETINKESETKLIKSLIESF
ncbi:hypothetical protein DICPUDRAFT_88535 [Dictyostelium purpureum]|uniref:Beta-catenin-like protein 1 N-terminal domain-containing protein n=1 Tax=Dictyostelium purpureum TaxID=5786 RepID=F0ZQ01_DICPU|nr:uncharacterized protein DICPUDRAFT_88535 [Dictyostelium purpureum]EGC33961.1 hypothetical protein DICPUDRAFT_88535 [Dictyostelium purpureum]|eukprot:XP_003289494.1 hypothetical protein DICPUDRAFT_88535 [Dictyostelium purpureum]